jgi:hypothetical protein
VAMTIYLQTFLQNIIIFLKSNDLAQLFCVCKDWKEYLQNTLYEATYNAKHHSHPAALSSFLESFRNLSTITIKNVSITDANAHRFPELLSTLRSITVQDCLIATHMIQIPLINLHSFSINPYIYSCTEAVAALSLWTSLREVSLHGCVKFDDNHLNRLLTNNPLLESITISKSFYLVAPNFSLGKHLKSISIIKASRFILSPSTTDSENQNEIDKDIVPAHLQPRLLPPICQKLDFSFTRINCFAIEIIMLQCLYLEELHLVQCPSLSSPCTINSISLKILNLEQCFHLQELMIDCLNLQILEISLCSALQRISLETHQLQSLSCAMLPMLKIVRLRCPQLRQLDLSGCHAFLSNPSTTTTTSASTAASTVPTTAIHLEENQEQDEDNSLMKIICYGNQYFQQFSLSSSSLFLTTEIDLSRATMISQLFVMRWIDCGISKEIAWFLGHLLYYSPRLNLPMFIEKYCGGTIVFAEKELLQVIFQQQQQQSAVELCQRY